jgi:hypothetical protein
VRVEALGPDSRPNARKLERQIRRESMRTRSLAVWLAFLGGVAFFPGGLLLAKTAPDSLLGLAGNEETRAALVQVREAIAAGEAGHATALREFARQARDFARSDPADPHLTEAARHLEQAMTAAEEGDTSAGLAHAREAQRALEAAG